ncbi:hypothetical protein [Cyanobium sp. BA5m-10]|uniref:hypothetical protein n=1 Tax=Cyanobium sp. BA5m-10 TaxID=2823705 RepID=UPI0020CE4C70|nr:hypothetical protein [Cyanobium sp. BA5m-10]
MVVMGVVFCGVGWDVEKWPRVTHNSGCLVLGRMAKPKGFGTMCWLGLMLNGFGIVFALFVAVYERIDSLVKWPSLIELEIFQSDAQIMYLLIGGFVCAAQAAILVDLLRRRINRIRGLVVTILAAVALAYLDTLAVPEDPFNPWSMLIELLLAAIPIVYFCRKSVYDYLDGQ